MNPIIEEMKRQQGDTATAPQVDPIIEQMKQGQRDAQAQAAMTVSLQAAQNADEAAKHAQLAKRYNTSPEVVAAFPQEFKDRMTLEMARASLNNAPKLSETINASPNTAAMIHDDLDNASSIEQTARRGWAEGAANMPLEVAKGLGGSFSKLSTSVNTVLGAVPAGIDYLTGGNGVSSWWRKNMIEPGIRNQQMLAPDAQASFPEKAANMGGNLLGMLSQVMLTGGATAPEAAAAPLFGESTGQAILGQVQHGVRSMAVPAVSDAVDMGRRVYDETGDKAAAIKAAQAQYIASTLNGVVPMSAPGALLQRTATGAVSGVVTGEASRHLVNSQLPEHMQTPWDSEEAVLSGLAGAVFGIAGPSALHPMVSEAVRKTYADTAAAHQAEQDFAQYSALSQLSAASKWRNERDPESFRDFVRTVTEDGNLANVYVDANTFAQSLEKAGVGFEELQRAMPEVAERLKEGAETDGFVSIPTEDYMTHIAGTPLDQAILPHLRTDPEGKTYAEAQEFFQKQAETMKEAAVDLVKGKAEADAFRMSQKVVQDEIQRQLDARGIFTTDANKTQATVQANMLSRLALRMNITPEEAFAKYGPTVMGGPAARDSDPNARVLHSNARSDGGDAHRSTATHPGHEHGPFGPQFTEYHHDPEGAIAKLLEERNGEATGALHHPEIGDIDLVWGEEGTNAHDGFGLAKLARWHPEVLEDLQGIVSSMKVVKRSENRAMLESADHKGGVRLQWDGVRKHWLLTAFRKDEAKGGDVPRTDTNTEKLADDSLPAHPSDQIVDQTIQKFYQGQRGSYAPDSRAIALLKNADLSTYIHETGHWALDIYSKIAARTDAPPEIRADVDKLLKWFGITGEGRSVDMVDTLKRVTPDRVYSPEELQAIDKAATGGRDDGGGAARAARESMESLKDITPSQMSEIIKTLREVGKSRDALEVWNSMSIDEQRPHHENLARAFEAYFLEGKAPSAELSPVFARIRSWMINIYKSLRGLNVELTPEVRGVFDRMLATDEAIAEAQAARVFEPLFKTKPEGMTDEEWTAYQGLGEQATADAIAEMQAKSLRDMKWLSGAKSRALKDLQKQAKAQRQEVMIDARRDVLSEPIYQAWSFLTAKIPEYDKMGKPTSSFTHSINPSVDGLLVAIAKLGGLDRQSARQHLGVHPGEFKNRGDVFGKPIFRKEGGKSADAMAEELIEHGYLRADEDGKHDIHDFEEKLANAIGGDPEYSMFHDYRMEEPRPGEEHSRDPLSAGRLDVDSLRVMGVPEDVIDRLQTLRMTAKHGIHPDIVADIYGMPSGDKMVRGLADVTPPRQAIEGLTDRYMLERHGELATPQALEAAANAAVHNEARAKFIATGLKALAKSPVSARELVRGAKEAAEAAIASRRVRDINPRQYEVAETRANKEALKLVAKDPEGAIRAQRSSLLNNQLAKAARQAQTDVGKTVDYFKRMTQSTAQGAMRGEYLDQLNALLSRFDLRTSVGNPAKDRKPLGEWVQEEAERLSAVMPDLPEWVLNEGYKTHYSELTVEQVRGLRDAVKQLEHMARREQKQYMAIRAMEFAAERGEVLAEIRNNWGKAFDADGLPKDIEPDFVPGLKKTIGKLGDKFAGEFLNAETILSILGGGKFSVINESLFGRLSSRSDWKAERLTSLHHELKKHFDAYSAKEKFDFARKDIATPAGLDTPLTRENALVVALLHGNADGRERLTNYGWSEGKQQQIISLLDSKDRELANAIWRTFDHNLWPELKDLNDRTRGKAPPKVEAVPYTSKAGEWSGGYFRLKYDTNLDERAHRLDEGQAVKELLGGGMGMSAKTNQGSSTERKQNVRLRPRLDLSVFAEAVNETVHDLAYREAVADTMRMLNDKGVMTAVKQVVGVEGYRALVSRVREVAAPPRNPSGYVEGAISIARRNTIINLMSGVKTALQNFTGWAPALAEVNAGNLGAEIARFYSPKMAERYDFAMSQSAYMRQRFHNYDRDLQNNIKQLTVNGSLRPDESTFLALMGFVDRGVTVPLWNAAFKEGMGKFANDTAKSVDYADHIVRQTQGSGRDVDLAKVMSGHGGWGQLKKAFTMFYSYFNSQLGLMVKHGVISKLEAQENPAAASAKFAAKMVAIIVVPTVLTEILMNGVQKDGESEEEQRLRFAGAFVKYGAGFFPFVRDIVPGIWASYTGDHYFGTKISPIDSAAEGVVKAAKSLGDVVKGENDERDTKNLIMGVGYLAGVPGKLISDTVDGTRAWLNGEAGPQAVLWGPPKK